MSLFKIAWRSIQQRALSSWLTGLSMALGVALVVLVLVIHGVVSRSFSEAAQGYHLILGAKGGKLQLLLNTVFHLSQPIENVPYSFYEDFIQHTDKDGKPVFGKYASAVQVAVPVCLGDSYKDFRVVGTTPDLFDKLSYGSYNDGTLKKYSFSQGENFQRDDFFGAVIGSVAAVQTGLKPGERFAITHGLADDENAHVHENEKFRVVGILNPTGTPNDRAIFVNMEGFYLIGDHGKPIAKSEKATADDAPLGQVDVQQLATARDELREAAEVESVPDAAAQRIRHAEEIVGNVIRRLEGDPHKAEDADQHEEHNRDDHKPDVPDKDQHKHDGLANDGHDHDSHDHDSHDHDSHDHHDHAASHDPAHRPAPLPDEQREVTAILLLLQDDVTSQLLFTKINEGQVAQAVYPGREVANLFEGIVGPMKWILLVLAVLVVIVAGIGVMVSIYNSMSDRGREIAVMRALGAGRSTVMIIVLLESILLSLLGGAAGVLLGHGAIAALSPLIVRQTGVAVGLLQFEPIELILIPCLVLLASLVGYLPALAAYRTDVAKALSQAP